MILKILWWMFFWSCQLVGFGLGYLTHKWLFMVWCGGWAYYGLCRFTRELEDLFNKIYHQP